MDAAPTTKKPLIGIDEASIDDKGRILVAKKKRERLGELFALNVGSTGCLNAYPQDAWEQKWSEIQKHDSLNFGREQYARLFLGPAEDELKFDSQGRVVIPQRLREAAMLIDKVTLVGAGDHLEIWATDQWIAYNEDPEGYGAQRREALEKAYRSMVSSV